MSTRQTAVANCCLLQQNVSPKGDASQSALLYLSKEVSDLAPVVQCGFMEAGSGWFGTADRQKSPRGPRMALPHSQSPLKLLNLINQQCERILNQSEDEDRGHTFLNFSDSNSSLTPNTGEQLQDSAQTLNHESHRVRESDYQLTRACSLGDTDLWPVAAEVTRNIKTIQPEVREATADVPQTSEHRVNVALNLSLDWMKECLTKPYTFYDFLPESHPCKESSSDEHLAFRSNDTAPLLHLDHNANILLSRDEALSVPLESAESCSSFQQQPSEVNTASTCEDSSEEIPKLTTENCLSPSTGLDKDHGEQRSSCASKRRKQTRPIRSASVQDPDFQGVTFRMDRELDDSKEQCRLLITSKYSRDFPKNVKRTRHRTVTSQKLLKASPDSDTCDAKSKVCASCCTSKTPMWRDAEDGTPLCNACGIRYKKYRVRCIHCWHIPRKDGNSVSRCSKCGHSVKLS